MKDVESKFGHVQVNVDPANLGFYRDLFGFLGWSTIHDGEGMLGVADANEASLWFGAYEGNGTKNDYDGIGVNHLAIHTGAQKDVDATVAHLKSLGVEAQFQTPRHRPDFGMGEGQTYYQVMFKTPDNLLLEVVYIGAIDA